jgi:signal transduction histidine kinase
VPGRLARAAADDERRQQVEVKQIIIRYLSHEVRSPLNIISSALSFLQMDLTHLLPGPEKDSALEYLSSMRIASQDILQTMNEMLQMETINSGNLSLDPQMVPCKDLIEIAQCSGIVAKEKGVHFSVQDMLTKDVSSELPGFGPEPPDLEGGFELQVDLDQRELPRQLDLALYVDKFKIGQVVRNLVTNEVKLTPAGQSVTVNVRRPTAAEETSLAVDTTRMGESDAIAVSGHAIIEVVDTGVGISAEDHSKLFGAFAQFRANELQVPPHYTFYPLYVVIVIITIND